MRHQPLLWPCATFAAGILIARGLGLDWLCANWAAVLALVALAWAVGAWTLTRRRGWPAWPLGLALALSLAALGGARYAQQRLPLAIYHQKAEHTDELTGTVDGYPTQTPGLTRFVLRPDHDLGAVQVFVSHPDRAPPTLHQGDRLRLTGDIQAPRAFDGFDYPSYLANRGIWAVAWVREPQQLEWLEPGHGNLLLGWGQDWREAAFARVDRYVPAPHAASLKALLFGERALLDDQVESAFRDAGVAHVLAVSGLHLGIVVAMLWWGLRGLGASATVAYALIGLAVGAYLVVVGFKVTLVRAALLFGFLALGHVLRERGWVTSVQIDPLQGWAAAALVILGLDPQALFDAGFQLSFAATGAILLAQPLLGALLERWGLHRDQKARPWPRRLARGAARAVVQLVAVSLAAQLGALPIVAHHFGQLYLGTVLANLWAVPWVTVVLWLGVAGLAVFFGPWSALSVALGGALAGALGAFAAGVETLARWPGMAVAVSGFTWPWVWAWLGGVWVLARWGGNRVGQASRRRWASENASAKSAKSSAGRLSTT